MNDKMTELLEKLAVKLGVTVDHLWAVLVAQVRNQAIAWIIEALFFTALTAIAVIIGRKYLSRIDEEWDWEDHVGGLMCLAVVASILLVVWICIVESIGTFLAMFNNPEYVALKNVLKMLKGS
jgi:hypothetical protein